MHSEGKTPYSVLMALETLTVAELTAIKAALLTNITALAAGSIKKYTVPGLNVERYSVKELLDDLCTILEALSDKTDTTGGQINVEFGEPEGDPQSRRGFAC